MGKKLITPREKEVLAICYKGYDDIAKDLFITKATVQNHLSNLYKKFNIHTQAELYHFYSQVINNNNEIILNKIKEYVDYCKKKRIPLNIFQVENLLKEKNNVLL